MYLHHGWDVDSDPFKLGLVSVRQFLRVEREKSKTPSTIFEIIDQLYCIEIEVIVSF